MSDEQIAFVLVTLCKYQVHYTQEHRLRDAVKMRKHARAIGREILRRIELGEWCNGNK